MKANWQRVLDALMMNLAATATRSDFWYLATPYTRYRQGIDAAYREACRIAARLINNGWTIYSPIAHTHGIALHGDIDPGAVVFWLDFDKPLMGAACGLLVATMAGWSESEGIAAEIAAFREAGKPVRFVDPETMEMSDEP